MKTERIKLHSDIGRSMLVLVSYARWVMPLAFAFLLAIAFVVFGARRPPVLLLIYGTVVVLISRWAALNATTVFATPAGLEMPGRRHTAAWHSVNEVREVPFVGGLVLNVYRVTFDDGSAPLTFYGTNECEQVIRRFKDSSRLVESDESAA
jgi:hypothetical protein